MGIPRKELGITGTVLFALLWTTPHAETRVYPRLIEGRADDGDLLLNIHTGLTLHLRKSSILARDFVLTSASGIETHSIILNGSQLERDLYHDTEQRSSIIVRRKENGVEVRGILNDQLRITPAVLSQRSDEGLIPHDVFTVEERSSTPANSSGLSTNDTCAKDHTKSAVKTSISNCTSEFVVEMCVVAGPTYWSVFNKTEDLVTYVATGMNAANFWFTDMEKPAVKLQLNRIIQYENDSIAGRNICGPTLYELNNHNTCAADILDALNATVDLKNECGLEGCDLLLQLTRGNLAMEVNGACINRKVQGVTNLGGVCTNYSAAVVEDEPLLYSGVSTMAHEIAHATLSESCIQVHTKANYSNKFYPGQNMTADTFCKNKHPEHDDVEAQKRWDDYPQCKIHCCWKSSLYSVQKREDISVDLSDYEGDYSYEDLKECQLHTLLEAMSCGGNKTCWRGVCGEHNWTKIHEMYHTDRTF
ncbi:uncharacterized protein LOC119164531 isoform X4 [Rhipicephalus microplus]|uniref:uncharacterized protein LOC119164531 isoform X4 n=1 Tax=Rhipicephalus microplus TaxID=6941 RepID=UPI003F6D71C8